MKVSQPTLACGPPCFISRWVSYTAVLASQKKNRGLSAMGLRAYLTLLYARHQGTRPTLVPARGRRNSGDCPEFQHLALRGRALRGMKAPAATSRLISDSAPTALHQTLTQQGQYLAQPPFPSALVDHPNDRFVQNCVNWPGAGQCQRTLQYRRSQMGNTGAVVKGSQNRRAAQTSGCTLEILRPQRKRARASTSSGNIWPVSAAATRLSRPRTTVTGSPCGFGRKASTAGVTQPLGKS